MYTYTSYGLSFNSQIELPEFLPSQPTGKVDVYIQLGRVDNHLDQATSTGILYQATPHQFLLSIDHVARYLIKAGCRITIQPTTSSVPSDIRVFLLGSCLGALLHQRGILALHASAIDTPYGAVLFTGYSGVGKSTLLNAMLQKGYKMMADDISALSFNQQQKAYITPGFPRTKLWADAAHKLNINTATLPRTRPQLEKYERYLPKQFQTQAKKIHRIFHLTMNNSNEISITTLPKLQAIQVLLMNTYRQQFLDGLEKRDHHFQQLVSLTKQVALQRVIRPKDGYYLDELVAIIDENIHQL